MPSNQRIEPIAGLHTLLNNLFDQVLFELAIFPIKVVALVA
ncbi:hypothetical protein [Pseudomonas syringae]|nr:hypothetical protein [Pseudomonas syringae]